MANPAPTTPDQARAAEVCTRYEPGKEARQLLRDDLTPEAFTALLLEQHREADGVEFLAHGLTARQAVWWGCLCAWEAARPDPPEPAADALRAAVHWVEEPNEANRARAEAAGRAAGLDTAAGGVAMAAARTGGSVTPPGYPVVPPGPFLPARIIINAIRRAAAPSSADPSGKLRLFLRLGREVAGGILPWERVARRPAEVR
jgi:hypothetical protein